MTVLALATLASPWPMGQQRYEEEVAARAGEALGPSWDVRRVVVRSLRAPLEGTVRLPARLLTRGSVTARQAAGRLMYRGADVVHRMDLRLPPAPGTEILTVHDVVSWRFPDEIAPPPSALAEARRARVVVCPSQFSAEEIVRLFGVQEVVAIHNGVDEALFGAVAFTEPELAAWGIRPPFVLNAGGCTYRKNLRGLAEAWPAVHASHPEASLVLVGPPDERRDRLFGSQPGCVRLGRVPTADLHRLLAAASAVVVPSLYEGFGLPAVEGMAVGAPVVAARRTSLPEVCGDGAVLVEPTKEGLAEGLIFALAGGGEIAAIAQRGLSRARQFSWASSADAHARLWRRCP